MTRAALILVLPLAAVLAAGCSKTASAPAAAGSPSFDTGVKALFAERCGKCHIEGSKGGLTLASLESTLQGGEDGPVITPGDAEHSPLYAMVTGASGVKRMPPKGDPLSAEQLGLIKSWIDSGAK